MAADGSIVIDVELNDNKANRGLDDLKGNATRTGNSFLSLGRVIAGIGAIVIGSKLITSVRDFTVSAVQAAGSAQALSAQFSQVFGELENQATQNLNNIAEETNILPNRLRGSFTQISAFARTAGFDNAEALDLSTRATIAAADAAAFYDRSIESVTESLQSYLKGNFENDAALGFASTETTRNAVANQLYGKSFIDLSEAQKQLTLLTQVEQANALGGALGQAAREGTGLENVQGNLNQAFQDFRASVGDRFLDTAITGIIALTEAIQNIDTDRIGVALGAVVELFINLATSAIPIALSAIDLFFNTLETISNFIQPILDSIRDLFTRNSEEISSFVNDAYQSIRNTIQTVVTAVLNFIQPILQRLQQYWEQNGEQIQQAVTNAFTAIKAVVDFVMPAIRLVIEIVWQAIQNIITGALDVILGAVRVFSGIFTGDFRSVWEGIQQIFRGAIDLILGLMTLSFFGGIRTILTNLASTGVVLVRGLWTNISNIFRSFIDDTLVFVTRFVTNIINSMRNLVTTIINNFRSFRDDAFRYLDEITAGIVRGFEALPGRFLQIGRDMIQGLINGLKSLDPIKAITSLGTSIIDAATGVFQIFSPSRVFRGIGEFVAQGLAIGIERATPQAVRSSREMADATIAEAVRAIERENELEEAAIRNNRELNAEKQQQQLSELRDRRNSDEQLLSQIRTTLDRRRSIGQLSLNEEVLIWQNTLSVLTEGTEQYIAARASYQDNLVSLINQESTLGNLSLAEQASVWRSALNIFVEGSSQYINANRQYQGVLEEINNQVVSINSNYQKRIEEINNRLIKQEQDLTKQYEDSYNQRYQALQNFSGLFDEFGIDTEITGRGLLQNLEDQVSGFQNWQVQIDTLAKRAIDDGLLAELRKLGPGALSELVALNSLTDEELRRYSDLFLIRTNNIRVQTEREFYDLRVNTGIEIAQLRSQALVELNDLELEWTNEITNIVNATEDGFSSMEKIGIDAATSLLNGLSSVESSLVSRAQQIANSVQSAFQQSLNLPTISGPSLSGLSTPQSLNSSSLNLGTTPSVGKTQINNITVETNNQKVELERLMRQNTFAF